MLTQIFNRLRRRGLRDSLNYFAGRFETVRRMRRAVARRRRTPSQWTPSATPFVEPFDIDTALDGLRRDSVFTGLRLQDHALKALADECARAQRRDTHDGALLAGAPPARTGSAQPAVLANCDSAPLRTLVHEVGRDPQLLALATRFLGRAPRRIEPRVQESLVVQAPTAFRESRNQTVTFHYDVHDLDFLYVFFYLSDVTARSGAHELMRGTHRGKALRHVLASARQEDEEIYRRYGRERALVIEGPPGSGFAEDTSCFHRALVPTEQPRLALQIRYS